MIGSDGLPHDVHPHPRLWGTFPRVLGHYCREVGLFSLEAGGAQDDRAVGGALWAYRARRCRAGAYADLCVFDADSIIDRASFAAPTLPAAGIDHVFVNGRPVWSGGKPTGERPGRALRRQPMRKEARARNRDEARLLRGPSSSR